MTRLQPFLQSNFTIKAYYLSSWRVLILSGVTLAIVTSTIHLIPALVAVLVTFYVLHFPGKPRERRTRKWPPIIVASGLVACSEWFLFVETFDTVSFIGTVLTAALPIFLNKSASYRFYWFALVDLVILAFTALFLRADLTVYVLFSVELIAIAFNLNAATMLFLSGRRYGRDDVLPMSYFLQFLQSLPAGIVCTLLIFFLFPRISPLGTHLSFGLGRNQTGYSGEVTMLSGRSLEESNAHALYVEGENSDWHTKFGSDIYFRGGTLEAFDGEKWTPRQTRARTRAFRAPDPRITRGHKNELVELTVLQEKTSHESLFYPGTLRSFSLAAGRRMKVYLDSQGSLELENGATGEISYEVTVSPRAPKGELREASIKNLRDAYERSFTGARKPYSLSRSDYNRLTEVPAKISNAAYFQQWLKEVEGTDPEENLAGVLAGLSTHFRRNFKASLINSFSSSDSFKAFLAQDRRGHCEYFATAATLLLRSRGIPARIALGYRGGEINDVSGVMEVLGRNAHAWVEYFVPNRGWERYDPTPLANATAPASFGSFIDTYVNALSFWFKRYVADYGTRTQMDLVDSLSKVSLTKALRHVMAGDLRSKDAFDLSVLVFSIGVLVWVGLRWRRRRRQSSSDLPLYYVYFLKRLNALGHAKRPEETYRVFHQRISGTVVGPAVANHMEMMLERDLYSPNPTDKQDRRTALGLARSVGRRS